MALSKQDWVALKAAQSDAAHLPNDPMPAGSGPALTYAINHSPLGFGQELLARGADAKIDNGDGYPPLLAALSTALSASGHTSRSIIFFA